MEKWFKNHIAITLLWVNFLLSRLVGIFISFLGYSNFEDTQWIYFLIYGLLLPVMNAYVWGTLWKVAKKHEPEVKVDIFFLLMLLQIGMQAVAYGLQTVFVNSSLIGADLGWWLYLPTYAVALASIVGIWASKLRLFGLKTAFVLFLFLQIFGGMAFQGLVRFVSVDSFWITSYSSIVSIIGLVLIIIQTIIFVRANKAVPGFHSPSEALIEEIGEEEL